MRGLVTLHTFTGPDGSGPVAGLVQASDGNFYSTTYLGGAAGYGTVFRITPLGVVTVLHSFCQTDCADGANPIAGLTQGIDGELYGTTYGGGANGQGTIFKITRNGQLTTLHSFDGIDGTNPEGGLLQGTDGHFYGTTYSGANQNCLAMGCGTIFRITSNGALTTLHNFCPHSFCSDGGNPIGTLIEGADGRFYGTASAGGDSYYCGGGCGTIFNITPEGEFNTMYLFCSKYGCADGSYPSGGLVQGTDGNFYGTTLIGGSGANCFDSYGQGCGTVFEITPVGQLTTLHSFDFSDAGSPWAGLIQDTNGNFYGTSTGGSEGLGTVFGLSVGLGSFASFSPHSFGKDGQLAGIIGQGFTGAMNVSFNGISASFTVRADTFLTATVPSGATTGYVTVTTPSGVLTSNVPFVVVP